MDSILEEDFGGFFLSPCGLSKWQPLRQGKIQRLEVNYLGHGGLHRGRRPREGGAQAPNVTAVVLVSSVAAAAGKELPQELEQLDTVQYWTRAKLKNLNLIVFQTCTYVRKTKSRS